MSLRGIQPTLGSTRAIIDSSRACAASYRFSGRCPCWRVCASQLISAQPCLCGRRRFLGRRPCWSHLVRRNSYLLKPRLCGEHPVLGSVPVQPHPVRCISIDIQQCAADASHRCSFAAAATTMALLMLLTSVCCRCCRRRSQRCGCNWHHCNQITSVAQQLLLEAKHSCLSKNPCCSGMQLQRIIAQQRIANNIGKQDGDFAERVLAIHRCARLSTRPPPWRPASGPKAKPQRVA